MKRRHLFEFHELPGCPDVVRRLVTDYLEAVTALFSPFSREHTIDLLIRAMRSTGAEQFVDLCSGSGGPWFCLAEHIQQRTGNPVSVLLSDRSRAAKQHAVPGRCRG